MDKEELLALVEEGFRKPAWHGPNLRNALRGVTAGEAVWRPAKGRHNIWEIVVHAAYWKHIVTQRLTGNKENEFPEKGRNWFVRGEAKLAKRELDKRWKDDLRLLATTHERLRTAIVDFKQSDWTKPMPANRQTAIRNATGIAMHDIYHAGQIRVLSRLYRGRIR